MRIHYTSRLGCSRPVAISRLAPACAGPAPCCFLVLGIALGAQAQGGPRFSGPMPRPVGRRRARRWRAALFHARALTLDVAALRAALAAAPAETQVAAAPLVLRLPLPDGHRPASPCARPP